MIACSISGSVLLLDGSLAQRMLHRAASCKPTVLPHTVLPHTFISMLLQDGSVLHVAGVQHAKQQQPAGSLVLQHCTGHWGVAGLRCNGDA